MTQLLNRREVHVRSLHARRGVKYARTRTDDWDACIVTLASACDNAVAAALVARGLAIAQRPNMRERFERHLASLLLASDTRLVRALWDAADFGHGVPPDGAISTAWLVEAAAIVIEHMLALASGREGPITETGEIRSAGWN